VDLHCFAAVSQPRAHTESSDRECDLYKDPKMVGWLGERELKGACEDCPVGFAYVKEDLESYLEVFIFDQGVP